MSLWLIRAGSHGEFEPKFLEESRVYVTWLNLAHDLHKLESKAALISLLETLDPGAKPKKLQNHAGQIWPFAHTMQKGDWVVLPLKTQQSIYIGEITSDYHYEPKGPNPFYHWRSVKWIGEAIPRQRFGQDLLHSFGAFLTICRIQRNNAEARVKAMKASGWGDDAGKKGTLVKSKAPAAEADDDELDTEMIDLEQEGLDRIAMMIQAKFAGHGLTRLVEGILKAQGYTTYLSPEGADGGADILAGMGALGFGTPQLCVEVKSELAPIDRPHSGQAPWCHEQIQRPRRASSWPGAASRATCRRNWPKASSKSACGPRRNSSTPSSSTTISSTPTSKPSCPSNASGPWPRRRNSGTITA
jgi:restriction system protein